MNILYLTSGLNVGGTELFTLDLVHAMTAAENRVIWGGPRNGQLKKVVLENGINLKDCGLKRKPFPNPIAAALRIRKVVREEKIDLIHAVDAYSALIACTAFRYSKDRPALVWTNVGIGIGSYARMYKMCADKLDLITTETHYVRNRLIEAEFDPKKIQVFYKCRKEKQPTISRDEERTHLHIQENDVVIGSVGRLDYAKGNHTIIEAMPLIIQSCSSVKLVIVGNGPDEERLKQLAVECGVADRVVFEGFRIDIENVYQAFDIVAFPTFCEALGHICFEAMAYHKPLVASYVGGIIETVKNEENGLLVPPGDPNLWAKALIRVITDKQLAEDMVKNGDLFIQRMDTDREICNRRMQETYRTLCRENKQKK